MRDTQEIIKGLECCIRRGVCEICPYFGEERGCKDELKLDALTRIATSVSHEAYIQVKNERDVIAKIRPKITRCKDCKWFEPSNAEEGDFSGRCRNDNSPCQNQQTDAVWFCGDGEEGE